MRVSSFETEIMLDNNKVAIAALTPSKGHISVCGGIDWGANGPGHIGAFMLATVTSSKATGVANGGAHRHHKRDFAGGDVVNLDCIKAIHQR